MLSVKLRSNYRVQWGSSVRAALEFSVRQALGAAIALALPAAAPVIVSILTEMATPARASVPKAAPRATASADTATVILLGTGMPYPDHAAQGPATAVLVGRRLFLFDAGAGVERQM